MALDAAWLHLEGELKLLSGNFRNFAAAKPVSSASHFTLVDECLLEGLLSRVWQCWNVFCRRCVIQSCVGTVDATGRAITGLNRAISEADVSGAAIRAKRGGTSVCWGKPNTDLRAEPTWGDIDVLTKIVTRLCPANSINLLAAFSSAHVSAKTLQVIRNSAAHNHAQNLSEVLMLRSSYIAFQIEHPTQACSGLNRSQTIFW